MLKGLTSQLMNNVTPNPRGLRATPLIAVKSTLSIMGNIIIHNKTPIGMFTCDPCPNCIWLIWAVREGNHFPNATPTTIHRKTHSVR